MELETQTQLFSSLGYNFKIVESSFDPKFTVVRVAFGTENPPALECDAWIQKFSSATATNWITNTTWPTPKRFKYRKLYDCQHSGRNKTGKSSFKLSGRSRIKECKAKIDIHVKLDTVDVVKKDPLLKLGLNAIIKIFFDHSHLVDVAEAYSFLRMTEDTQALFEEYFSDGMTPSSAKTYHEMKLISVQDDENETIVQLANSQINPSNRQVSHLYDKWRENYGGRDTKSTVQALNDRKSKYKKLGVEITVKESPLIVVIITPIMRRAHSLHFASDIVFVDSSGSCDQTNTCVTFMFGAAKVGAVPLACVLHTGQSEDNYTNAFSTVKAVLGEKGFNGKGYPNIFMTDDSTPERNALTKVFPCSALLLCTFHVCQAVWRWLWDSDHMICLEDRKLIIDKFRKVIFEGNTNNCKTLFDLMMADEVVQKYPNYSSHMEYFWERRAEWAICYRQELTTRGNNTNNFVEASIRIFKDIVLERCKSFKACALVDFIGNVFESYHQRKLIRFATRRVSKPDILFLKLVKKSKDLVATKLDENLFHVESSENREFLYLVQSDIGLCDCPAGNGGAFCKHLCAVHIQFGKFMPNNPSLSPSDCATYATLAFGENVNTQFFRSMTCSDSKVCDTVSTENMTGVANTTVSDEMSELQLENFGNDGKEVFEDNIQNLTFQLARICYITAKNFSPSLSKGLLNLLKILENVETPSQIERLLFSLNNRSKISSRQISVQPTGIARRKKRSGLANGAKRIQAGRPSNMELGRVSKKRVRNLGKNIQLNIPNAKSHGRAN